MARSRRKRRSFFRRGWVWLLATVVVIVLGIIGLVGREGPSRILKLEAIRSDLQEEVDHYQTDNPALEAEIEALQREDPMAIESRAREDLGMSRPDEVRIDFKNGGEPGW